MEFKAYRKIFPTKARVLTQHDYEERQGIISTLEGRKSFVPGDYLAQDAKGEWPIKRATMQQKYEQVAPEDELGFALYIRPGQPLAAQVPVPFAIEGLQGKAGDYLILSGGGGWPVDREIFEQTYQLVEEAAKRDNTL